MTFHDGLAEATNDQRVTRLDAVRAATPNRFASGTDAKIVGLPAAARIGSVSAVGDRRDDVETVQSISALLSRRPACHHFAQSYCIEQGVKRRRQPSRCSAPCPARTNRCKDSDGSDRTA